MPEKSSPVNCNPRKKLARYKRKAQFCPPEFADRTVLPHPAFCGEFAETGISVNFLYCYEKDCTYFGPEDALMLTKRSSTVKYAHFWSSYARRCNASKFREPIDRNSYWDFGVRNFPLLCSIFRSETLYGLSIGPSEKMWCSLFVFIGNERYFG